MNCPSCDESHIRKNGRKSGKQNYICVSCGRQFIDKYEPSRIYSNQMKEECLKMYLNGMGFRGIERVKGVHHTTLITWIKQLGKMMVDAKSQDVHEGELSGDVYDGLRRSNNPGDRNNPLVGELDELETFVGSKKNKIWLWTAVNHFSQGILGWVLGDHSAETFKPLWEFVSSWQCYFYVTDGWKVYPQFIDSGDHIVSKTYMTRVEGENTRLRHYLARLHRKTLCYSKSVEMLKYSIQLLLHYLKYRSIPIFS